MRTAGLRAVFFVAVLMPTRGVGQVYQIPTPPPR